MSIESFSMQVMLLGFVLLGRSLEEKARIQASSDMNELLVSCNVMHLFHLIIFQQNKISITWLFDIWNQLCLQEQIIIHFVGFVNNTSLTGFDETLAF